MEYIQTAAAKDESTKLFEQQKQELRKYHSENESKRQVRKLINCCRYASPIRGRVTSDK